MSNLVSAHSRSGRRRMPGKRAENESFLPDDVVRDILSRLPIKDVLRYRCVRKGWRDLTSTGDFIDLHFENSLPVILTDIDHLILKFMETTMLDGCWEPARTRSRIFRAYRPRQSSDIYFSHNGLIVTRGRRSGVFVIYNPVYTDAVNINIEPYRGVLCAVFFHPVQQELCTLWEIFQSIPWLNCQYKILSLESNSNLRDIRNPFTPNHTERLNTPVLVGNFLYWLAKFHRYNFSSNKFDIVEYDITKEEFRVLPCPTLSSVDFHLYVDLIDIDGVISVVQLIPRTGQTEVTIRTLKDDVEQFWISSSYIVCFDIYTPVRLTALGVLAFRNGELVVHSEKRLFVFNLKLGTFRKFGQTYNNHTVRFVSHVTSLVSLKNCKSDICIVNENENSQRVRDNDEEIQPLI